MKSSLILLISLLLSISSSAQRIPTDQLKDLSMRSIGPAVTSGRVTAIDALDNDPNTIYVGTASGGLWKSENGGTTWAPIFDKQPLQGIGSVAIDSSNPDVIWAGTGEGNPRNSHTSGAGIYKSIDAGRNWNIAGLEKTKTIHRVIVDPSNGNNVFAGCPGSVWGPNPDRGVYKTEDGGKNWIKSLYVNDSTGCADLVIDPRNPNKLFAAMWEFGRKPYFFNSGGKGSGLHMTLDGGKKWTKLTEKNGLPEGELGRIGLAIAPSNPKVIYALIECKNTGLYKSADGGFSWSLVTKEGVDDRPFYYHEIYVDPLNENHLFYLHSIFSESIDGGKTWGTVLPYWGVHPDHHAFWISDTNPKFMIEGNDGGLNISRDGGANWQFVNNLPLGQFYHINVDNDIPYHVYGGMQDNGSWKGPGYVWHEDGIRDEDWLEVAFGDGFDVVPYPKDSRYLYAMSQGGNVMHIDSETGENRFVRPEHPDTIDLRYNWNAAIGIDPHLAEGVYFGSQFLHYSSDRGLSWKLLSPDLTTNDTNKLNQAQSGGLTIDATAAENYCTIISICPDHKDASTIWVGTDDGNLQLTKDKGKTWKNISKGITGWPKNGWISQVVLGPSNNKEVFVVVNNYRQNDWKPYLFYSADGGTTWKNLVDEKKVNGHCLSIAQDHKEPRLLFLGTENGLYVSIDRGINWTQWTENYPSVATQDLKIQEREDDLVIGTFGRAAFVMDAIQPLRDLASLGPDILKKKIHVYDSPDAYMAKYTRPRGQRFPADHHYTGDNKGSGVLLQYHFTVDPEKKEKDNNSSNSSKKKEAAVEPSETKEDEKDEKDKKEKKEKKTKITILSMSGDTLRSFEHEPDTGLNRLNWHFDTKGFNWPSRRERNPEEMEEPGNGPSVVPGKYKVVFDYQGNRDSTEVVVHNDPRIPFNTEAQADHMRLYNRIKQSVERADKGFEQLKTAKKTIDLVKKSLTNVNDSLKKDLLSKADSIATRIKAIEALYMTPDGVKGISDLETRYSDIMWSSFSHIDTGSSRPGGNAEIAVSKLEQETDKIVEQVNQLLQNDWVLWKAAVDKMEKPLFKEFEKL
ncbi:MAG: hypothetical protein SGI87_02010 [Flavobacteriales bacterium]|nr:hypothetical protein [Flavobacteriales bacterium]